MRDIYEEIARNICAADDRNYDNSTEQTQSRYRLMATAAMMALCDRLEDDYRVHRDNEESDVHAVNRFLSELISESMRLRYPREKMEA